MENNKLIDLINGLSGLISSGGVSDQQIKNAEKLLNLKFAADFKQYLTNYGQIEAPSFELMGISNKNTTSVVGNTLMLRNIVRIPSNMYIIEDIGIDGIAYLQNTEGEIFQLSGMGNLTPYAKSLSEYIEKSQL